MNTNWYYADRAGQQQGPVDAAWLAAAVQRGEVDPATLVWREGLAGWEPLQRHSAELGVQAPAPMPPASPLPPPRYVLADGRIVAAAPPAGSGGGSKVLLWAVIAVVAVVVLLGILAAIAIPAYQEYRVRSQVVMAIAATDELRTRVAESVQAEQRCLYNGEDGIGEAESYAGDNVSQVLVGELLDEEDTICAIQVFFRDLDARAIPEDASLLMVLQQDGSWRYAGEVPSRYLPATVRASLDD